MQYFDLNTILNLDIPEDLKQEFKEKFNQKVFYEFNDSCELGTLVGIADNHCYIINVNGNNKLIPLWKSITKI